MPLLKNTISRTEAAKRVQNWLAYAVNNLGFTPEDAPKAIFIPREDVEDALHEFDRVNKQKRKASGVRIYFTKNLPTDDTHDDLRLSCIVVPTVMSNLKDARTGKPIHNDAIITIPALERSVGAALAMAPNPPDGGDGEGTETIYDFTSPCPTDCGGTTNWGGSGS